MGNGSLLSELIERYPKGKWIAGYDDHIYRSTSNGQAVVVKIAPRNSRSGNGLVRSLGELRLNDVHCHQLLKMIDFGWSDEQVMAVAPDLTQEAQPLSFLLKRSDFNLEESDIAALMRSVCRIVNALAEWSLFHLGISPKSIMLDPKCKMTTLKLVGHEHIYARSELEKIRQGLMPFCNLQPPAMPPEFEKDWKGKIKLHSSMVYCIGALAQQVAQTKKVKISRDFADIIARCLTLPENRFRNEAALLTELT